MIVIVQFRRRVGLALLQVEQEFQGAVEDADLVGERHRPVPFHEIHADIEIQRPVGLGRGNAGIHPEIIVALVDDAEIALRLPRDIFHGLIGQG